MFYSKSRPLSLMYLFGSTEQTLLPQHPHQLTGTSQGRKAEFPPENWIRSELREFGAINSGKAWILDLHGPVHPFFDRENWRGLSQDRYDALQQSFQLCTRMLEVGAPFVSSYLPKIKITPADSHFAHPRLHTPPIPWPAVMAEACEALEVVAVFVDWHENPDMWPRIRGTKRQGLTHVMMTEQSEAIPKDPFGDSKAAAAQAIERNEPHRQLHVTIASQYIDAILSARKNRDHDQNLIATFSAAMIIIREIGHVLFFQDIHQPCEHYWVNNNLESEPGNSFIAWFFNGWYPQDSYLDNEAEYHAFKCGMHWCKQHALEIKSGLATPKHPSGLIYYSIPLEHMSRMLSNDAWAKYQNLRKESEAVRRELLYPNTPFRRGRHARRGTQIRMDLWDWLTENTSQKYRYYIKQTAEDYEPHVDEDWDDAPIAGNIFHLKFRVELMVDSCHRIAHDHILNPPK